MAAFDITPGAWFKFYMKLKYSENVVLKLSYNEAGLSAGDL